MLLQKKSMALLAACVLVIPGYVFAADGVFVGRSMKSHNLTNTENAQMDAEFARQFGSKNQDVVVKTNNPWEAKKKQTQGNNKISWGECRDYALQQRSVCYKEGRDAYACERFYEARSSRCDSTY